MHVQRSMFNAVCRMPQAAPHQQYNKQYHTSHTIRNLLNALASSHLTVMQAALILLLLPLLASPASLDAAQLISSCALHQKQALAMALNQSVTMALNHRQPVTMALSQVSLKLYSPEFSTS